MKENLPNKQENDYWPSAEEYRARIKQDAAKDREELERLKRPLRIPHFSRQTRIRQS